MTDGFEGRREDLARIRAALETAADALRPFTPGQTEAAWKSDGDPVTAADLAVDEALRESLPREGEGWLSEETVDDATRLGKERCWIVDPIDGTRGFVAGRPEWCVSVALVEGEEAVAGGILAPTCPEGRLFLGAPGLGLEVDGRAAEVGSCEELERSLVLTSRSEWDRGEWKDDLASGRFTARPVGSVALKLAKVAAGLADATWTLQPRHEWDVAAGVALVSAGGGDCWQPEGGKPRFNQENTLIPNLAASGPKLFDSVRDYLDSRRPK